ncbi:MAG TPA: hypothetical protein VEA36_00300 [Candidatus Paceibacterota bacterium]|nr:hypothetical protein [Candidatus Paceibacterota bacterium]
MRNLSAKQWYWIGGGATALLLAAAVYFQLASTTGTLGGDTATTQGLPPEPAFSLPTGATAVDDYAFTKPDGVYFRSLNDPEPLRIPDADPATFMRLIESRSYATDAVVRDCGGPATYTFYGDAERVYMHQYWRVPDKFRSSRIEVLVGADRPNFQVNEDHTATDGARLYTINHQVSTTSTCWLMLSRSEL